MPGFFGKVSCVVGIHDWDDWHYLKAGSCEQEKTCKRGCGATQHQTSHSYGAPVYGAANSCVEVATCTRCGDQTSTTVHEKWSEWSVSDPSTCLEARHCERCGTAETRHNHNFGPNQYKGPHSCDLMTQCSKCHVWEDRGTEHEKMEWRFDRDGSCAGAETCTRCGFKANAGVKHAVASGECPRCHMRV